MQQAGGPQTQVTLAVRLPIDSATPAWTLDGRVITLTTTVSSTVKELKEQLSAHVGEMPASKQQLKHPALSFLKDSLSLAHFNIQSGTELALVLKQRGGRR